MWPGGDVKQLSGRLLRIIRYNTNHAFRHTAWHTADNAASHHGRCGLACTSIRFTARATCSDQPSCLWRIDTGVVRRDRDMLWD